MNHPVRNNLTRATRGDSMKQPLIQILDLSWVVLLLGGTFGSRRGGEAVDTFNATGLTLFAVEPTSFAVERSLLPDSLW